MDLIMIGEFFLPLVLEMNVSPQHTTHGKNQFFLSPEETK